jgi:hypothetical protein
MSMMYDSVSIPAPTCSILSLFRYAYHVQKNDDSTPTISHVSDTSLTFFVL